MKVLFAAAEAVPFCKTGGLADVAGALPLALKAKRHDVRLVLPKYRAVDEERFGLKPLGLTLRVPLGDAVESVSLWEGSLGGKVPVYFVDAPKHFDRDGLYVGSDGKDHPDNDDRFILFSRAVIETAKAVDFRPDIVHAHDWQVGLVPAYLGTIYALDAFFLPTSSVFTIHNIAYQGIFPKNTLFQAGFSWTDFTPEKLEYFDQVNFLKAGIVYAGMVNTVSPGYAREVVADERFGMGMEGVLRRRGEDFSGILNGLDTALWNPAKDPHLAAPFSAKDLAGRAAAKADLQKTAGIALDPRAPLVGFVARLDRQKGTDAVLVAAASAAGRGAQAVILGNGDPKIRAAFEALARRFPGRVGFNSNFSDPLAHKIYGGADVFLMPSRFEPCGLGQLIALRYGAVPVVTPTGGLKDTVVPFRPGAGTGFVAEGLEEADVTAALSAALGLYQDDPAEWSALQRRGMAADFGWSRSVDAYLDLYARAARRPPEP